MAQLLATLQTILGIFITCLALWLLLWAPNLPVTDNPYWSGMSVSAAEPIIVYCTDKQYRVVEKKAQQKFKISYCVAAPIVW